MKYRSIQFYFLQEIRLFDRVNYKVLWTEVEFMEALKRTLLRGWTKLSHRSRFLKSITSPKCGEPILMPWFPGYRNLVMVNPQSPRSHYLCWGSTCNGTLFSVAGFQWRVITYYEGKCCMRTKSQSNVSHIPGRFCTFKNLMSWCILYLSCPFYKEISNFPHCNMEVLWTHCSTSMWPDFFSKIKSVQMGQLNQAEHGSNLWCARGRSHCWHTEPRASQEMPTWFAQCPPSEAHGREKEMNCHMKNPVRDTDLAS